MRGRLTVERACVVKQPTRAVALGRTAPFNMTTPWQDNLRDVRP